MTGANTIVLPADTSLLPRKCSDKLHVKRRHTCHVTIHYSPHMRAYIEFITCPFKLLVVPDGRRDMSGHVLAPDDGRGRQNVVRDGPGER